MDLEQVLQLMAAVNEKSYPLAVGLGVMILITLVRKAMPDTAWDQYVPEKLQWLPAVVLAALTTLALSLQSGEEVKLAVVKALYGALASGLMAVGAHRVGKETTRPATPPQE